MQRRKLKQILYIKSKREETNFLWSRNHKIIFNFRKTALPKLNNSKTTKSINNKYYRISKTEMRKY